MTFKEKIDKLVSEYNESYKVTRGQFGAVISLLNRCAGGDENRRLVIGALFGVAGYEMSTSKISDAQKYALYESAMFWQDSDNTWQYSPEFQAGVLELLTVALRNRAGGIGLDLVNTAVVDLGGEITDISSSEEVSHPEETSILKRIIFDSKGLIKI